MPKKALFKILQKTEAYSKFIDHLLELLEDSETTADEITSIAKISGDHH